MNLTYPEIFAVRGRSYDAAMRRYPEARRAEFDALFVECPAVPTERILDVPAGGGYLSRFVQRGVHVTSLELTPGFGGGLPVFDPDAGSQGAYDHVVCLAALHHIEEPQLFLRSLLRQVKTGGVLHVANVAERSPITHFLDDFVGRYNGTGHTGVYLSADPQRFAALGSIIRLTEVSCPWRFGSATEMLAFCRDLFGLQACTDSELQEALVTYIGVRDEPGNVWLDWRLLYLDIRARP